MRSQTHRRLSYLFLFSFLRCFPRRLSFLRLGCVPYSSESCACARPSRLSYLFLFSFLPSFPLRLSFLLLGCRPCTSGSCTAARPSRSPVGLSRRPRLKVANDLVMIVARRSFATLTHFWFTRFGRIKAAYDRRDTIIIRSFATLTRFG